MFNFEVLVNDRPVKRYYDRDGQIWIEARPNIAFTLKLKNNSYNRVLGIVSVDGLNVIDAKHVPIEDSRGYIINSYSSINIPGWKINENEVREFYFTLNGEDSYARKVGADERNIGVIGAAVYEEKINWNYSYTTTDNNSWYPYHIWRTYDSASSTPLKAVTVTCSSVNQNSGYMSSGESLDKTMKASVGSGEKKEFKTYSTDFEKGNFVGEVIIYYDTWEGLKRRGVLRDDRDYRQRPQPFGSGKFCPDI